MALGAMSPPKISTPELNMAVKMNPMDSMMMVFEDMRDGIAKIPEAIFELKDQVKTSISNLNKHLAHRFTELSKAAQKEVTGTSVPAEDRDDLLDEANVEDIGESDSQGNEGGGFKFPEIPKVGPKLGLALLLGGLAALMKFGDKLVPIIAPVLKAIKENILPNVIDYFKDFYDAAVNLFTGIKEKVITIFGGTNPDGSDATILDRLTALGGIFTDFAGFILNIGNSLITNVLEMFGVNFEPYDSAGAWVLGKLNEMWQGISKFFTDAKDFVVEGFTGAYDFVSKMVMDAFKGVTTWFSETGTFLLEGATGIIEWIKGKLALPFEFLTNLFSFTEEDATAGGIATKLLDIILLPYNLAINFLRGIFGFGEDEEGNLEPFSLGEFIIDKIKSAIDFIKDIFSFDVSSIKEKFSSMANIFKGLAAGGAAAAAAMLPGGESPGEAFNRVFTEYTKGNESDIGAVIDVKTPGETFMTQDELGVGMQSNERLRENSEVLTQGLENSLENQEKIANVFGRNSPEYEEEVMRFNAIDNRLSEVEKERMNREASGSVTVVNQNNSQNNNTSNSSTEQTPGLSAVETDYTAKALSTRGYGMGF